MSCQSLCRRQLFWMSFVVTLNGTWPKIKFSSFPMSLLLLSTVLLPSLSLSSQHAHSYNSEWFTCQNLSGRINKVFVTALEVIRKDRFLSEKHTSRSRPVLGSVKVTASRKKFFGRGVEPNRGKNKRNISLYSVLICAETINNPGFSHFLYFSQCVVPFCFCFLQIEIKSYMLTLEMSFVLYHSI